MSKVRKGFTLIELSLSMMFIGLLSLIMVVIIMNAVSSYRRGLTLDLINTTGMDLIEEFRTAVQGSPARSLKEECTVLYSQDRSLKACQNDASGPGKSLAVVTRYGNVVRESGNGIVEETISNIPIYGALCTGKYTYVWNSGYFLNDNFKVYVGSEWRTEGMKVKYGKGGGDVTSGREKLVKFSDEDRLICKMVAGYRPGMEAGGIGTGYVEGVYRKFEDIKNGDRDDSLTGAHIDAVVDVSDVMVTEEPEDLLRSDRFTNLALFDLTTAVPAKVIGLNDMFYSMSFVLGTLQGGASVVVAGGNCKPPEDGQSDFDYCAINKFNFAAQANGG